MHTVPFLPDSAPFTIEQRAWLNGYLAGLFSRAPMASVAGVPTAPKPAQLAPLTILFGSQTGTAEGLAKRAAKEAGKRGFAATVRDMAGFTLEQFAQEKHVLVITSTYGEGEPPDNAKALHAALAAGDAGRPKLVSLRYSVCALGDTNYVQFCRCGKDFDAFLEKLGGTRVSPMVECDLDYEGKFAGWLEAALGAMGTHVGSGCGVQGSGSSGPVAAAGQEAQNSEAASGYSRQNPFPALVRTSRTLNGTGSAKQVNHVEFELGDSGLAYEAGDALGVYAHNCPELVSDVLTALGCDGEEEVPSPDGGSVPLRRALTEFYDLGRPTAELISLVGASSREAVGAALRRAPSESELQESRDKPAPTAGQGSGLAVPPMITGETPVPHVAPHNVIDALLSGRGARRDPADVVRALKRLQPRLYSISSSPKAHAGQVHLTVGAVRYELHGRARKGVCSTFLADRIQPGETRIPIYVHANTAFRLPTGGDTPMIMIGPGTGIAPFRAFLSERRAVGAKGRNWLFFGDQRAATDFLYRDELETLQRDGVLTRLDTAFSRDQAQKIYVQHRILEQAREVYAWLQEGAHVYVCGDASRMAKDVDEALHRVVEIGGGRTREQAADYVQALRAAKRYQRDVY